MSILQAHSEQAAAINTADVLACRILVPYSHRLASAKVYVQNVVTTGTVTASLKFIDPNQSRGGTLIGTALNNATLLGNTNTNTGISFTLSDDDKLLAPANRIYFLVLAGTNSADRVDEPVLVLDVTPAGS